MKSNKELSILSGLGLFLVVFGHSNPLPDSPLLFKQDLGTVFYNNAIHWIGTFHLPLFIFISGYAYVRLSSAQHLDFASLMRKKGSRLLIPYVLLSSIAFPIKAALSMFALRPVSFHAADFIRQLLFPWNNVIIFFWFLPTLFLMLLLTHIVTSNSRTIILVVLSCSIATFFIFPNHATGGVLAFLNLGGVMHNYVYFWSGYTIGQFHWERAIAKWCFPFTFLSMGIFALTPIAIRETSDCFALPVALLGITGAWSLAHYFPLGFFDFLGNYSFSIYLLSWFPQTFFRIVTDQILHAKLGYVVFCTFIPGLFVPILIALFFLKLRFPYSEYVCGLSFRGRDTSRSLPVIASERAVS